jgi:prepilin peptidase CpaA
MLAFLIVAVFAGCMIWAAVSDMLSMTIANRIPVILVASFVGFALLAGMGWTALSIHVAVGIAVLLVTFAMFAAGAMGGGDAKLIAATSLWLGLSMPLAQYLVWSALIGGLLTVVLVLYRVSPLGPATVHLPALRYIADREKGIPYGIALGIAGLLVLPNSVLGAWALARLQW